MAAYFNLMVTIVSEKEMDHTLETYKDTNIIPVLQVPQGACARDRNAAYLSPCTICTALPPGTVPFAEAIATSFEHVRI